MRSKPITRISAALTALLVSAALIGSNIALSQGPATTQPGPALSTTPINLTIDGTVVSGTGGASIPPGLPISLHIARINSDTSMPVEVIRRDAALATGNTFRFDKVTAQPGDIAFVTTTFEGVVQGSQLISLTSNQSSLNIPVTLYAATTDPGVITLLRVQHILDFKPGDVLQVLATYDYQNTSDRLYFSNTKTANGTLLSVSVPLPIGARAIAFNTQLAARFMLGGDINARVVQDTKPVLPGQLHEIVFSYQLPYETGAAIDQDYPYATTSLEILIPDDIHVTINDDQFTKSADNTINPRRPYTQYQLKSPLRAGDRLIYTLTGAAQVPPPPSAASSSQSSSTTLIIIGSVVTLIAVIALAGVQRVWRRRT